jgi:CMP-N,N'-diacetyllegionaminic acid synthase
MYKNKSILALIPARGGSKGIPKKNIIDLCGKPLIAYTILAAKDAGCFDDIVVSTDSVEIADVAKEYGVWVPFMRPSQFATDKSTGEDVSRHAIAELSKMGRKYDIIVYLQPTSPLRTATHILEALDMFIDKNLPSLTSVSPVSEHPLFMRTLTNDGMMSKVLNISSNVRRQDLEPYYLLNGAIYINYVDDINNSIGNDNKYGYIMDTKYGIDINTIDDLDKAKKLLHTLNF